MGLEHMLTNKPEWNRKIPFKNICKKKESNKDNDLESFNGGKINNKFQRGGIK